LASPYIKGRRVEYRVKEVLEGEGYYVVRAAGSHGLFDLVAINPATRRILLVQVRGSERGVSGRERGEMARFAGVYTVVPAYTERVGRRLVFRYLAEEGG